MRQGLFQSFSKRTAKLLVLGLTLCGFSALSNSHRSVVRIMPLGDSITWDITFGDTRPDGLRTGYRQPLWLALQAEGFSVDFVGSLTAGQDAVPPFDPNNEGHSGWTDSQIAANVYNFLTANPADVILLHIGTNGLDPSPTDVEAILNEVDRFENDHGQPITVFVARIINRVPYSSTTTLFNDNVQAMVQNRIQSLGDRLQTVDMEDGAGLVYQIDTSAQVADMYDYLHPNRRGYQKMASRWFAHLNPFLLTSSCPVGMSHYWKLDEDTGQVFADSYGSVPLSCSFCPISVSGIVGKARSFSGTEAMTASDDATFDWAADADFSVELWCQPSGQSATDNVLIGRRNDAAGLMWLVKIRSDGKASFLLQDNLEHLTLESRSGLQDGFWHHLAVTREGQTGMTKLFHDGILNDSSQRSFVTGFASSTDITVGFSESDSTSYFTGLIDEIALHDSTLSPEQIQEHYSAGLFGVGTCEGVPLAPVIVSSPPTAAFSGDPYFYDVDATGNPKPRYKLTSFPGAMTIDSLSGEISWIPAVAGTSNVSVVAFNSVAADTQSFAVTVEQHPDCPSNMLHYWTLDESSGSIYQDVSGSTPALCETCPTPVGGKVDMAKSFDRVDDAVSVTDDGSFDWGISASYSIEFWMKKSSGCAGGTQPNNEVIIGRAGAGWWIGVMCEAGGNASKVRAYFQGVDIYSSVSITDGLWHHLVFVRNNVSGRYELYVDGQVSATATTGGKNLAASDDLTLGWFNGPDPGKYRYGGILDEVAMYSGALNQSLIQDHYNQGLGTRYCFVCGDVNGTGVVNISDVVYLIAFIFSSGPPPPSMSIADVNCSGFLSVADVVYLISFVFGSGSSPCQNCK